ncbi:MAG: TIGR04211 family SH3 domain-containing protein [Gammaproteobacteria bacterium]|nr:TIGR04211 family SH3 domain-containing protein [Gammaproteobacteria bacterium]
MASYFGDSTWTSWPPSEKITVSCHSAPLEANVKKIVVILFLLLSFTQLQAENRYITDQFRITMRSGQSATHKIVRMLPSGYEVSVIESNPDSGYSRVRSKDGKEGYVLTRQLMKTPSARDRLAIAEEQLAELQDEPEKLSAKLANLQKEHQKVLTRNRQLSSTKGNLDKELEGIRRTAANAIRISNERNELRKIVAKLTHQVEELKQENRELENDTDQKWFIIGAGVIIVGIILGLILPHLRFQRRKSSWGNL